MGLTRYRPTTFGTAVLLGLGLALLRLQEVALSAGVLAAITAVMATDAALSRKVIAPTQIGMVAVNSRATTLDGLVFRAVPLAGSFEGLEIAVGSLGAVRTGGYQLIENAMTPLPVALPQAGNLRFVTYLCRHSTLGLMSATKAFVQLLPSRVAAIGEAHDDTVEVKPSSRPVELERLRDYVAGDRPNHVHWMASAKTGQLQVRDDLWQQDEVVIVLEASETGAAAIDIPMIRLVTGLARLAIEEAWRAGFLVRVISMHDTEERLVEIAERTAGKVDSAMRPQHDLMRPDIARLRDEYVVDDGDLVERLAGIGVGSVPRPNGPHYVVSKAGLWLAE